jgi:hypothetical protein
MCGDGREASWLAAEEEPFVADKRASCEHHKLSRSSYAPSTIIGLRGFVAPSDVALYRRMLTIPHIGILRGEEGHFESLEPPFVPSGARTGGASFGFFARGTVSVSPGVACATRAFPRVGDSSTAVPDVASFVLVGLGESMVRS